MFDSLSYKHLWHVFLSNSNPVFPEPKHKLALDRFTPKSEQLLISQTIYAKIARKRINYWLTYWNYEDRNEVIGRLKTPDDINFAGAMAEIYINAALIHLKFEVERLGINATNPEPDFRIKTPGGSFYLEASHIAETLDRGVAVNWEKILRAINLIESDLFYGAVKPIVYGKLTPNSKSITKLVKEFLALQNYDAMVNYSPENAPELLISSGGWELSVQLVKKVTPYKSHGFVGISQNSNVSTINDTEDLRNKVEKKRKHYGNLDLPFVLFIIENSFLGGIDPHHRASALYGDLQININADGTSFQSRARNGIWNRSSPDKRLSGLLLMPILEHFSPLLSDIELWVSPLRDFDAIADTLPFKKVRAVGRELDFSKIIESWNEKPIFIKRKLLKARYF